MQACVQCGSRFMNPYMSSSVRRDRDTKNLMRNRVQSKKACGAIVSARISNTELQYCQTARATKCQVHDRAISVLSTLLHAIKEKRNAMMIIFGIIGKTHAGPSSRKGGFRVPKSQYDYWPNLLRYLARTSPAKVDARNFA